MNQAADQSPPVARPAARHYLDFERPLAELEERVADLLAGPESSCPDYFLTVRSLQRQINELTAQIYRGLSPGQTVQVARHPQRPHGADYIGYMVQDFCELHGDRCYHDDRAILTGLGRIGRQRVLVVAHNKGRNTEEKIVSNFGCPHPEGYRKALAKMRLAEKFDLPIVCLIDTPGAYPGVGAEERGQAQAIANNLMAMSRLRTPIICIVIGEGGSGGALGIGLGDRVAMLEYAYYSVISPEGCAAILWRDGSQVARAAEALRLTSNDLFELGVVDAVIPEPVGGAHRNPRAAVHQVESYIVRTLGQLRRLSPDDLLTARYEKFRHLGCFEIAPPA